MAACTTPRYAAQGSPRSADQQIPQFFSVQVPQQAQPAMMSPANGMVVANGSNGPRNCTHNTEQQANLRWDPMGQQEAAQPQQCSYQMPATQSPDHAHGMC